jgi:hypothetical protein
MEKERIISYLVSQENPKEPILGKKRIYFKN